MFICFLLIRSFRLNLCIDIFIITNHYYRWIHFYPFWSLCGINLLHPPFVVLGTQTQSLMHTRQAHYCWAVLPAGINFIRTVLKCYFACTLNFNYRETLRNWKKLYSGDIFIRAESPPPSCFEEKGDSGHVFMKKILVFSWLWWYTPVIPAFQEAEAGEFQVWVQFGLFSETPHLKKQMNRRIDTHRLEVYSSVGEYSYVQFPVLFRKICRFCRDSLQNNLIWSWCILSRCSTN